MADILTDEYRDGLRRGELLIQKCPDCGTLTLYPKYACTNCQSEQWEWQPAGGHGVLHSFTVSRIGAPIGFEDDLPYALAVVKLDEGVQLLGRLIADEDGDWSGFRCDDLLEYVPTPDDDRPIAWFRRRAS
ncbi:hypothetical protein GIS00_24555 [Nakamurella sp. YIM 132087]|uniref:Benzoylsuccinyl-CoA thiolase n=1 Tax=Nakamurella alba TaxID=2665158 RepID=A0A7K1FSI2_9ACTN|nr:OB-fold domain-containing protein [Nakamurella alba]MTD17112.1 hypothetical protein [Nakamurella alba]